MSAQVPEVLNVKMFTNASTLRLYIVNRASSR